MIVSWIIQNAKKVLPDIPVMRELFGDKVKYSEVKKLWKNIHGKTGRKVDRAY